MLYRAHGYWGSMLSLCHASVQTCLTHFLSTKYLRHFPRSVGPLPCFSNTVKYAQIVFDMKKKTGNVLESFLDIPMLEGP